MIFEAWDPADPVGTKLGDLTEAFDKEIMVEDNGVGYGKFSIRQDSAEAAYCGDGTHIRVRYETGGPYLDFSFFLEDGQDTIVSTDEEGGEVWQRGGRGSLAYPEPRAVVYPTETIAGPAVVDAEGKWLYTDVPYGAILNDVIAQAKARVPDPLHDMTDGIGAVNDGNGVPWVAFDGEFEIPAGMNIFSAIQSLQSQGLVVRMEDPLTIRAYGSYGTDRSATIHFQKGVNIRESGERQIVARPIRSRVLVQGADGAYQEVTDAQTATLEGSGHPVGRREGFTMYRHSSSPAVLTRAGQQFLRGTRAKRSGPTTLGVLSDVWQPWTDYAEGDTVKVTIPGVWSAYSARIAAILVNEDDTGANEVTLHFEQVPYNPFVDMKSSIDEMIHGPGCKPGCGGHGGGTGTEVGAAPLAEDAFGSLSMYGISILDGEFGHASWQPTATGFENTPTVGLGAGIAHEYNESFAVCWPSNNAFRGSGKGYGQVVVDTTGESEPAIPLRVEVALTWDKSDNSLRICQTPEGLTGIGDGAAVLTTPGLFDVRVLPPGALAQNDVFAGASVGTIGGADSGVSTVSIPARYVDYGNAQGFRLLLVPMFEAEWAGWACKGHTGFDRTGIESFIHLSAVATIVSATGAGWVTGGVVGAQDGSNTDFTLHGTAAEVVDVYVNGLQQPPTAWSFDSGTGTLTTEGWAPVESDLIEVEYRIE